MHGTCQCLCCGNPSGVTLLPMVVGSGGLMVRAPASRLRGWWFDSTSAISWAISFTPLCSCLSEETLKAVGPNSCVSSRLGCLEYNYLRLETNTRMRCAYATSTQVRPCLKPLWHGPVNKLTLCWMLRRTAVDMILRILLRNAIGLRLDRGPSCFFGFGSGTRMPLPTVSSGVWVSNTVLMVC